jgi:hypothetical protein
VTEEDIIRYGKLAAALVKWTAGMPHGRLCLQAVGTDSWERADGESRTIAQAEITGMIKLGRAKCLSSGIVGWTAQELGTVRRRPDITGITAFEIVK